MQKYILQVLQMNNNLFNGTDMRVKHINEEHIPSQLCEWNQTESDFPKEKCIHELFEIQVKKKPESTALIYEDQGGRQHQLSYAELNRRSNQLAHYLTERGVQSEVRVGVCLERSLEVVISILAILKAGACYVPLDPIYPEARLRYIQQDSDIIFAITQSNLKRLISVDVINIDFEWDNEISNYPTYNLMQRSIPINLAYIIYTSGSTGKPKGVSIEHQSTVSLLAWAVQTFDQKELQTVLAGTSICFDLSIFEMFVPLCFGHECILVDDILSLDNLANKYRVTIINTVPSVINALLSLNAIPKNIHVINLAGERLQAKLVDKLYAHLGDVKINDLYGPSEATTYSTYAHRSVKGIETVGKPVANTTLHVLNQDKRVPIGEEGELHIGGIGLARGYLNRASLTAEKFTPNQYSNVPGARLYGTGDLARYLSCGNLEYIGRVDHQVKIRGFRIELGEIENLLSRHSQVKEAVVTSFNNGREHSQLVAYVVSEEPQSESIIDGSNDCNLNETQTDDHVDEWKQVYDRDLYSKTVESEGIGQSEAKNCFDGWLNSYDRSAIPLLEMQVWADLVVDRINRTKPEHILELGCGVGLLLHRLLPDCKTYVGSDFSENALTYLKSNIPSDRQKDVDLICCEAKDFSGYGGKKFDTIVINSVLQCFPNIDYLMDTIGACIKHLRLGGTLFLGDVRNYDLLGAFATSIELSRIDSLTDYASLLRAVNSRVAKDDELLVSPRFFQLLKSVFPEISHIEILPKYDITDNKFDNELFRYRFDAVLHINESIVQTNENKPVTHNLDWRQNNDTEQAFRDALSLGRELVSLEHIPDSRLQNELQVFNAFRENNDGQQSLLLDNLINEVKQNPTSISLTSYVDIALEYGYKVEASLVGEITGEYSLKMWHPHLERPREELTLVSTTLDFQSLATDPMRLRRDADLKQVLREYLKANLPEFMIPSALVVLTELPINANGKIDRKLLPAPDSISFVYEDYVSARTEREKVLVDIWEKTLNINPISILDNFFSLGGDSILSIQLVSQAKRCGYLLTTSTILEHPTIESLAAHMEFIDIVESTSVGELELLPMQQLCLSQERRLDKNNHLSMLLTVPDNFDLDFLQEFVIELYERHDVFRLCFSNRNGNWIGEYTPVTDVLLKNTIIVHPISGLSCLEVNDVIDNLVQSVKESIEFTEGPLIKLVYFNSDNSEQSRLLLVAHHLVIDTKSLSVLYKDLIDAFEGWRLNQSINLSNKTHSFQSWCKKIANYSETYQFKIETDYWQSEVSKVVPNLPLDNTVSGDIDELSCDRISIAINKNLTFELLNNCHQAYHTKTDDLLLSALFLSITKWTGQDFIRVNFEEHERAVLSPEIFGDVNVDQTVGCFSRCFPLTVQVPASDSVNSGDKFFAELIRTSKEELRNASSKGVAFDVMKSLSNDDKKPDATYKSLSNITFGFFGNFDQVFLQQNDFSYVDTHDKLYQGSLLSNFHNLGLSGWISKGQLQFNIEFRPAFYSHDRVKMFADLFQESLSDVIQHCSRQLISSYTSSDFPQAKLNQEEVDLIQDRYPSLVDCYSATDLQSGIIFHSRHEQDAYTEGYIVQVYLGIEQAIDVSRFKQVWDLIAGRYDSFRSAFDGFERNNILQVVVANAELCWVELDWRNKSDCELDASFEDYCREDRRKSFDLTSPSLMRFVLIRERDNRYRFLWTYHHSILDGWSMAIILREMNKCYSSDSLADEAGLPKAVDYKEYLNWLKAQDKDIARKFWSNQLDLVETKTDLGLKRTTDESLTSENHVLIHKLSVAQSNSVERFAKSNQVTLNIVILASWAYLLSRYSDSDSVVFGQTASGRDGAISDVDGIVGLLIRTIPAKINVSSELTIRDWLRALHHKSVEREKYSYLSLTDIQKCSSVPLTETLFDTLVAFINYPMDEAELEFGNSAGDKLARNILASTTSTEPSSLPISLIGSNESTNYDLSLVVIPSEQLTFKLNYRSGCFSAETIKQLMTHLSMVIEGIVGGEYTKVGELPMLSAQEQHKLLFELNESPLSYTNEKCIHEIFEENITNNPDAIAVVHNEKQLSFRELNSRSNQLAYYLVSQGIDSETRVVVHLNQSIESIICFLAILKSGGVYVPIDTSYSKQRIDYVIRDSSVSLILTQKSLHTVFDFSQDKVFCMDRMTDLERLEQLPETNICRGVTPQNLAYVVYTSGSTGKPKGVMQTHQTITNVVKAQCQSEKLDIAQITLQLASISFDVSIQEIITSWFTNSKLVLVENETRVDNNLLLNLIEQENIERIFITPVFAYQLFQQKRQFDRIQKIIFAGEQLRLNEDLVERLNVKNCQLLNHYGPTETHAASAYDVVETTPGFCPPIGRALTNVNLYILSRSMHLVPMGGIGELYISGSGLARCYTNQANLTAEKFVPHPYSQSPGERLYRTGDFVRYLPDGNIEFIGRIDHQVKVRGFRVELGEITTILLKHDKVKDVVVLTFEDKSHNNSLVAYVVTKDLVDNDVIDDIRDHCRDNLPAYMLPSSFVLLESFPVTSNGKLDRSALPKPDVLVNEKLVQDVEGETEEQLAKLWCDIFQLERVGRNDNFFELGGHSILLMQLVEQIHTCFQIRLSVADLLKSPTIFQLALLVDQIGHLKKIDSIDSLTEEEAELLLKQMELN